MTVYEWLSEWFGESRVCRVEVSHDREIVITIGGRHYQAEICVHVLAELVGLLSHLG